MDRRHPREDDGPEEGPRQKPREMGKLDPFSVPVFINAWQDDQSPQIDWPLHWKSNRPNRQGPIQRMHGMLQIMPPMWPLNPFLPGQDVLPIKPPAFLENNEIIIDTNALATRTLLQSDKDLKYLIRNPDAPKPLTFVLVNQDVQPRVTAGIDAQDVELEFLTLQEYLYGISNGMAQLKVGFIRRLKEWCPDDMVLRDVVAAQDGYDNPLQRNIWKMMLRVLLSISIEQLDSVLQEHEEEVKAKINGVARLMEAIAKQPGGISIIPNEPTRLHASGVVDTYPDFVVLILPRAQDAATAWTNAKATILQQRAQLDALVEDACNDWMAYQYLEHIREVVASPSKDTAYLPYRFLSKVLSPRETFNARSTMLSDLQDVIVAMMRERNGDVKKEEQPDGDETNDDTEEEEYEEGEED